MDSEDAADSLEESREKARVTEQHIENAAYTKYPGNYHGHADEWSLEEFSANFTATIFEYHKGRELEIDLVGIGAPIANAYRRIMIAEVPTVAIEHCFIYNNTSVIQDEMLAHRIGLVPLRADPTLFKWKPAGLGPDNVAGDWALVFTLKAKCEKRADCEPDRAGTREDLYKDHKVYSGHMVWEPIGKQKKTFSGKDAIRPVHQKILVAKLSGKQELDLKLHAVKGIGRDHAKFSPVATASYRLMPEIKLLDKISGDAATRLKESFSEGVIKLDGTKGQARVANARIDSGSRNVFRHQDLKERIQYDLLKDYFIFKIESTGCIPAADILLQSCDILESKCQHFLAELQACRATMEDTASVVESI